MSRREECIHCGADQHVCKMCLHYTDGRCHEERAEAVSDAQKANFCDYFAPLQNAHKGGFVDKSAQAKAELAALFGESAEDVDSSGTDDSLTPAELAERKLAQLLNQR